MALAAQVDLTQDPLNISAAALGMVVAGGLLTTTLTGSSTTVINVASTFGMKVGDTVVVALTETTNGSGVITAINSATQFTIGVALGSAPFAGLPVCDIGIRTTTTAATNNAPNAVLTVVSTAGMKVGDFVLVGSAAPTAANLNYVQPALSIKSVDSATQITLNGLLAAAPGNGSLVQDVTTIPKGAASLYGGGPGGIGPVGTLLPVFMRSVKWVGATTGNHNAVLIDPVTGHMLWADNASIPTGGSSYSTILEDILLWARNGIMLSQFDSGQLFLWLGPGQATG